MRQRIFVVAAAVAAIGICTSARAQVRVDPSSFVDVSIGHESNSLWTDSTASAGHIGIGTRTSPAVSWRFEADVPQSSTWQAVAGPGSFRVTSYSGLFGYHLAPMG